jgi:hypothetical protein
MHVLSVIKKMGPAGLAGTAVGFRVLYVQFAVCNMTCCVYYCQRSGVSVISYLLRQYAGPLTNPARCSKPCTYPGLLPAVCQRADPGTVLLLQAMGWSN